MSHRPWLSSCRSVGNATAAFALAILEGSTKPGVWFPEEVKYVTFLEDMVPINHLKMIGISEVTRCYYYLSIRREVIKF